MSMPLSHFIPVYPSPPHVLKSILYVCIFILALPLGSSVLFFFRFHICALAEGICFPFSDLLHSVWQTRGPSTSLQITQFRFFLWLSNIPLYICAISSFFKKIRFLLFLYLWLCWVFASVRGLSLAVASRGHFSSRCAGLSLSRPLLLRSTGSRCAGSLIVAHRPSCSAACGIFPDQGSNPCSLHWQADSQPLRHQGSPPYLLYPFICRWTLRLLPCPGYCK